MNCKCGECANYLDKDDDNFGCLKCAKFKKNKKYAMSPVNCDIFDPQSSSVKKKYESEQKKTRDEINKYVDTLASARVIKLSRMRKKSTEK